MEGGFFSTSTATAARRGLLPTIPSCGKCGLHEACHSPKIEVDGDGRLGLLIVGEAPGETEDRKGRPFVGKSGRLLSDSLRRHGIDMRRDCWITNSVICRPTTEKGENRTPSNKEIDYCRPNLTNTIKRLKPTSVLLLGMPAVRTLIHPIWKENLKKITRWVGWRMPCREPDAWVMPTYHPSYVLRSLDMPNGKLVGLIWDRHLKGVAKTAKRKSSPWNGEPPDERKEIRLLYSGKEVRKAIRVNMAFGGSSAWDLETTCLKPWADGAEIVSCSICFRGKTTIAFPWSGLAADAVREYLRSDMPKRGANMKFEHLWARVLMGVTVNAWEWDAMQNAHTLDHRADITSVKFQALVRFGVPDYAHAIKRFLKSRDGSHLNRIKEVAIDDLLVYNGIDSLVEYRIADSQAAQFGLSL